MFSGMLASGNISRAQDRVALNNTDESQRGARRVADPFPRAQVVPEGVFEGGSGWLNTSQPISMKDLKGKIVLVDFWTYCCINCMHILPDLKYLEEKFEKELVVIGVHSAKFENEKDAENIRNAIMRYEIRHPVVNDDQLLVWRRFGTSSWPTLAIIDAEGRYIGSLSGEGNREPIEKVIEKLIEYHRSKGTLDETPIRFELEEGKATETPLRYPGKVLVDEAGQRVFVADSNHNRIVIASTSGELIDIVGSGRMGTADGSYSSAEFNHPQGMALVENLLYVADTENHMLRAIDLTAKSVKTIAGTGEQAHFRAKGGGAPLSTALNSPWSLAYTDNKLFIAMAGPHQIWVYLPNSDRIRRYAGNGREDVINGSLDQSSFAQPSEICVDPSGEFLYVVDSEGSAVRRVSTDQRGQVTTIAGTSELPQGQSLFAFGDIDGIGPNARLQHPLGVAVRGATLFVADSYNHKIKRINLSNQSVQSWIGTGEAGDTLEPALLDEPGGISAGEKVLYVADTNNHRICTVDFTSGEMKVFVIQGLAAPNPVRLPSPINTDDATKVASQTVKAGEPIQFTVNLNIPDGHKLNELAPVTWKVAVSEGQAVVPDDALNSREEATPQNGTASFSLPVSSEPGQTVLIVQMSYGYCATDESLCRLASRTWQIPVTLTNDAETSSIGLSFDE
ncbi:MAG: redoxin domain-containing protein [Planctomycetaceae bacterium]|nr:redoxin domain-containing protein [Planctomycetaceae bacterium]